MGVRFLLLLLAGWLVWPADARADGKVFSQVTAVKTTTPDQRALLHFARGTETLVVETTFVGAGTNFAWVVPLPAAPEITAVPRTVFTNLERLFQPEVIHKQVRWWIPLLGLVLCFPYLESKTRKGIRGFLEGILVVLCLAFFAGFFLPLFAKSRGSAGISIEQAGVQILARQTVGVFDTVTLSSPDGAALTRWLNEHGFAVPAAAAPVIADYAKAGWVFAAAKLSRPDASGKTSPHPLAFKFKTDRAVYPLRLTGVENDRCLVELYVFGESRAELPGFKVEHCLATQFTTGPNDYPRTEPFRGPAPGQLRLRHPALRSLVKGSAVGTKLIGTLDAAAMSRDAYFNWVPFERRLASYYSSQAATTRAINLGVAMLLLTLPCTGFWLWRTNGKWTLRLLAKVGGGVWIVGLAYFLALPRIPVEISQARHLNASWRDGQFLQLSWALGEHARILDLGVANSQLPARWRLGDFSQSFEREWGSEERDRLLKNLLTGEPLREEATPGNLVFRPTARGTEVLWHDVDCVEHVLATLPVRAP